MDELELRVDVVAYMQGRTVVLIGNRLCVSQEMWNESKNATPEELEQILSSLPVINLGGGGMKCAQERALSFILQKGQRMPNTNRPKQGDCLHGLVKIAPCPKCGGKLGWGQFPFLCERCYWKSLGQDRRQDAEHDK